MNNEETTKLQSADEIACWIMVYAQHVLEYSNSECARYADEAVLELRKRL